MNTRNIFFALSAVLVIASCETEPISYSRGKQIDKTSLGNSSVSLRSMRSLNSTVHLILTEGCSSIVETIYAFSKQPSSYEETIVLSIEPSLVKDYSNATEIEFAPLPATFCNLKNGNVMKIETGETFSEPLQLEFSTINHLGNTLKPGHYLLPVVATASSQKTINDIVYYDIIVREPYVGDAALDKGDEVFFVFYLNTKQYDPRLVSDYYLTIFDPTGSKPEVYATIGNILNLRRVVIDYDIISGRAIFNLGADIKYVLDHYAKYITPLQEEGRKICLSIEGANSGLGFCNMTDAQIKDFVDQIKIVFDQYPLDGINLWDRNSGYDYSNSKGLPVMNTTSYPKLIKSLREMLGPNRLLTLTDYGMPTEYFWDTNATGGIVVGEYLDYAWSGYCSVDEGIQVIDPWHQDSPGVSVIHPRKPICGLNPDKYGCVNFPWYPARPSEIWDRGESNFSVWSSSGNRQSNILLFEDLRTNLQDANETNWDSGLWYYPFVFNENFGMSMFDKQRLWTNYDATYGKWLKDW